LEFTQFSLCLNFSFLSQLSILCSITSRHSINLLYARNSSRQQGQSHTKDVSCVLII
jgi:hypothetical protein